MAVFFLRAALFFLLLAQLTPLAAAAGLFLTQRAADAADGVDDGAEDDDAEDDELYIHGGLEFGEAAEHQLVDDLYAASLLADVLAYIVYIIKEVAEGVEYGVGLCRVLGRRGVGDDADTQRLYVDVDVAVGHHGVAVEVDGARLLAADVDVIGTESLDLRVVAQGLHEQVGGYLGRVECIEGLHDDDVHQSVLHRGTGGDVGVVAVLRGVGAGNEEGLVLHLARLVLDLVGLRLVLQSLLQDVLDVGDRPALARLGELQRDERVEAHAAGAEEG